MHEAPDYTRVVFDTTGPVSYELFPLTDPDRIVIDLKNTTVEAGFDPSLVAVNSTKASSARDTHTSGTGLVPPSRRCRSRSRAAIRSFTVGSPWSVGAGCQYLSMTRAAILVFSSSSGC